MIVLNHRDPRPIYEQLQEKLRRMILSGAIEAGSRMPSVRELAAELAINPNTIQRAYRGLEAQGFIYTVAGKGSFAAPLCDVDDSHRQELTKKLLAVSRELLQLGMSKDALIKLIQEDTAND